MMFMSRDKLRRCFILSGYKFNFERERNVIISSALPNRNLIIVNMNNNFKSSYKK
jgi:hypothetical protein